jgi:hypothetical protein
MEHRLFWPLRAIRPASLLLQYGPVFRPLLPVVLHAPAEPTFPMTHADDGMVLSSLVALLVFGFNIE